jgi:hypothetical protein
MANGADGMENAMMQLSVVIKRVKAGLIRKVPVPKTNFDTIWISEPRQPVDQRLTDAKKQISALGGRICFLAE